MSALSCFGQYNSIIYLLMSHSELEHVLKTLDQIKIKLRSFKSSEHIFEKGDGPYRGFGTLYTCIQRFGFATSACPTCFAGQLVWWDTDRSFANVCFKCHLILIFTK